MISRRSFFVGAGSLIAAPPIVKVANLMPMRGTVLQGFAFQEAPNVVRHHAFDAFLQILSDRPELANVIGDLYFRAADFPAEDETTERLRRLVA